MTAGARRFFFATRDLCRKKTNGVRINGPTQPQSCHAEHIIQHNLNNTYYFSRPPLFRNYRVD
jgi:hypothetical protein